MGKKIYVYITCLTADKGGKYSTSKIRKHRSVHVTKPNPCRVKVLQNFKLLNKKNK
jgi:hypothetical protein